MTKTTTYACGCVTHWKVERMDPTPLTCPVHKAIWERTDSEDDTSGQDCICGPEVEPVERDDGSMGWHVIHHSLDGRERREQS